MRVGKNSGQLLAAPVRPRTLTGGLGPTGPGRTRGIPASCRPLLSSLSPSPREGTADKADGMWLGLRVRVCPSSVRTGVSSSLTPPPSSLSLFQACQLPRNPLRSITSRGRQSPSLPTAFRELLHPQLRHLREIQAIPRKVSRFTLLKLRIR